MRLSFSFSSVGGDYEHTEHTLFPFIGQYLIQLSSFTGITMSENSTPELRQDGDTESDIRLFIIVCNFFRNKDLSVRYETYPLWARCLRNRRTPFSPGGKFRYPEPLLAYRRHVSAGDIVDAAACSSKISHGIRKICCKIH